MKNNFFILDIPDEISLGKVYLKILFRMLHRVIDGKWERVVKRHEEQNKHF